MPSSIYAKMAKDEYFRLGFFYQISGDLFAAAECYERSIEKQPSAEAHTFLGWVLGQLGELDTAIEECKKAVQLDPDFGNAWNDIGAYLLEKQKFLEAIPFLKRACKSKNNDSRAFPHYNLARIYIREGMLLRAKRELKKACKINPEFGPAKECLSALENQIQ